MGPGRIRHHAEVVRLQLIECFMNDATFVSSDEIRERFSRRLSDMYRQEVPQYGALLDLVADINADALRDDQIRAQASNSGGLERLGVERHGAIRLGTAEELSTIRRLFGVMGMAPVGYYDLSVAGVPVHSTAFRPISDESLYRNPFRVFTSLLRLELIQDAALREQVRTILARRKIFTPRVLELTGKAEITGGLTSTEADEFVVQALETFRWHSESTVDKATYDKLHAAHRLIADVACFKGPHINHLTPRTLDIDKAQAEMPRRGIMAKDVVEGPPKRRVPVLLRQTSFRALQERVAFAGEDASSIGTHTARFGEIEQRGIALTRKGRALYDALLSRARTETSAGDGEDYAGRLRLAFEEFPDDIDQIRKAGLGFFRYSLTDKGSAQGASSVRAKSVDALVEEGLLRADPIIYEDFLPVSAAGIFQSNLGGAEQKVYAANEAQASFEQALGAVVADEIVLYEQAEALSLSAAGCVVRLRSDGAANERQRRQIDTLVTEMSNG
jgi:uncharacterized glyoxalase superfamily metalloenzyme YdcJ